MPIHPTGPGTPTDPRPVMPPAVSIRLVSKSVRLALQRKPVPAPASSTAVSTGATAARLRSGQSDASIVIGLALGATRTGTGTVPFDIVCALSRHASAGDPAACLVLDWLKRREERRLRERVTALGRKAGQGRPAAPDRFASGVARASRSAALRLRLVASKGGEA